MICVTNLNETSIDKLKLLLESNKNCVLLCGCSDYKRCHRSMLSDMLSDAFSIDIKELLPDMGV